MRRLKKGSTEWKKDPADPDEMVFKDSRLQTFSEGKHTESGDMNMSAKMELEDWNIVKGLGSSTLNPADSRNSAERWRVGVVRKRI